MALDVIFLIGFMGAGKSSIGAVLADRLGFRFVDLDDEISRRFGASIPEIFAGRGEAAFRAACFDTYRIGKGRALTIAKLGVPKAEEPQGISLREAARPSLIPVLNLTGTVLHTNLGRAALPREALAISSV